MTPTGHLNVPQAHPGFTLPLHDPPPEEHQPAAPEPFGHRPGPGWLPAPEVAGLTLAALGLLLLLGWVR